MVKTLPTVERSTQIRFGKHAQQDQGENTIVLNASNTAVDASNGGAVYVSPVRFRPDYEGNAEIVLMMYNTTTKELTESGESAQDLIGNQGLQAVTNQGNVTSNSLIFYNNTVAFVTTGNVGISNALASHTLSVGSNLYVDDYGTNVLVVSGGVGITNTTTSTSSTTGALKVAGGISTEENLNVGAVTKVLSATDASSKTTGALIVTGGVGISKNIHALNANFEDVEADSVNITDTTLSYNQTTGALKVAGGLGVAGNVHCGNLTLTGNLTVTGNTTVINANNLIVQDPIIELGKGNTSGLDTGIIMNNPLTGGNKGNVAMIYDFSTSKLEIGHTLKGATDSVIVMNTSNTLPVNINGTLGVTGSTTSSSKTTGAVTIGGGLGVVGDIHATDVNFEDVEADRVTITDNTTSTSATTGALKVVGGISTQENLNVGAVAKVISGTDATSKTTGALIVTGGVGISKNIHGKNVFVEDIVSNSVVILDTTTSDSATTGALKVVGGISTQENLNVGAVAKVISATDATSKTTGALIVTGGLGVAKNIHGKNVFVEDVVSNSVVILDTTTSTSATTGALKVVGGISTQENLNVGAVAKVISGTDATSKTTGALIVTGGLGVAKNIHGKNVFVEDVVSNSVVILDTTTSTSVTTGALKVVGGISTQEKLNVGGITKVWDDTAATSKTTGAVQVVGGLGVGGAIFGSAATFDGTITVAGDLIVSGNTTSQGQNSLTVEDPVIEVGIGNANGADLGIIMNNPLTGGHKGNVAIIYDFSASKLEIGHTLKSSADSTITMNTANTLAVNINGTLGVTGSTTSSSKTTGAVTIGGGVGISGALFGAAATLDGVVTLTDDTTSTSTTTGALKVTGGISTQENLHAAGMIKGATISGTNVYGTLAGANTAAVTTLTASGMVKGATISGTNVYGTLAGANTAAVTTLTASGMVKGATISGTNVYGTLAGANAAAVTTLTASAMVKGATISGTNVYGTLAGSNAAAITTLNASGVVTLADNTTSTTTTSGALKVAGGVGVAENLNAGGYVAAAYNQNQTSWFGRAAIGYNGSSSDHASFAHLDMNSSSRYALKQTNAGATFINAKDDQQVQFRINNSEKAKLTSDGDFLVDTDTLYVSAVNDRVGINKAAPAHALDVVGGGQFTTTLNVGGVVTLADTTTSTTTTSGALKVAGGVGVVENLNVGGFAKIAYNTDTTSYFGRSAVGYVGHTDWAGFAHLDRNNTSDYALLQNSSGSTIINCNSSQSIQFCSGNSTKLRMLGNGDLYIDTDTLYVSAVNDRVGINKAAPAYALDVVGDINFTGTFREDGNPFVSTPWTIETSPDALNYTAGNVGIGATDPAAKLTVTGDAQITTTLSVGGVVTLTDATESTSSTTGALKAAGGVGIAKDVFVGERAYVTGGLITNTGGFGKKTYSYSTNLTSGASVANATYVLDFTDNPFHAKVTAMLIESDDEISTLIFDVIGGKLGGGSNSAYVPALGMTSIISTSTMNTPWDSTIATSLTGTTVTIKPANACSGVVRFNIFVEYLSHETAGRLTSINCSGNSPDSGDLGY
jgi:hypothetical protein